MRRPTIYFIANRYTVYYIIMIIILGSFITSSQFPAIQSVMKSIRIKPLDNKIIVIDPGHGGIDGGTNTGDILEKNINLIIGLQLRDMLTKKGATVVMTRETDVSLDDQIIGNGSRHREDLDARVKIINDSGADLFISIHVNHIKNTGRMGPIAFYYPTSEEGKLLADNIQAYLNRTLTYKKLDIEVEHQATEGDFYVLRNTLIPGIIAEVGFLSNEIDKGLLLDKEHQNELVEQITKGIIYHINKGRK